MVALLVQGHTWRTTAPDNARRPRPVPDEERGYRVNCKFRTETRARQVRGLLRLKTVRRPHLIAMDV
jgi:hypothetical protein